MNCSDQPVQTGTVVVEDGRAKTLVNVGNPARPKDALFKGVLYSRSAVNVNSQVRIAAGDSLRMPKRADQEKGQQDQKCNAPKGPKPVS